MDKIKLTEIAKAELVKEIVFESAFRAIMHDSKSRVKEVLNEADYRGLEELSTICHRLQMIIEEKMREKNE
jgi:hypothetical protein